MAGERERIFPGDTLPVTYECRKPNPDDRDDSRGLPATPDSAFVRLFNRQTGEFVDIGGPGDTTAPATITPATGAEPENVGALVSYTVGSEFTQEPGDYALMITSVFPGGAILTEDKIFKINEFR